MHHSKNATYQSAAAIIDLQDRSAAQLALEGFLATGRSAGGDYGRFLRACGRLAVDALDADVGPIVRDGADLLAVMDDADRDQFVGAHSPEALQHEIASFVARYNREEGPSFCDTEFYLSISKNTAGAGYRIEISPIDHFRNGGQGFRPPVHVRYRRSNVKSKVLRSLDKYRLVSRIYFYSALFIVNIAAAVVLATSAGLISYGLLAPALYIIYLVYREASFLNNRIKLIRDSTGSCVQVKTLIYNDDKSMMKISKFEVTGNCPICGGRLNLASGGANYNGRIVARCEANYLEHTYSFDHIFNSGHYLN